MTRKIHAARPLRTALLLCLLIPGVLALGACKVETGPAA